MAVTCDVEAGTIKLSQPALIEAAWHKYGELCRERGLIGCKEPALEGLELREKPDEDDIKAHVGLPLGQSV